MFSEDLARAILAERTRKATVAIEHHRLTIRPVEVTVDEAWQRRGIGRQLAQRLCILARERGCDAFRIKVPGDDPAALDLAARLAPGVRVRPAEGGYEARFPLVPGR